MKKLLLAVSLFLFCSPAQGTEIVRQTIDVRLVPGAIKAEARLELAEPVKRPVFCLARSARVEEPYELVGAGGCAEGLAAWRAKRDAPSPGVTFAWSVPIELGDQPLVLEADAGWYPRGRETASLVVVRPSSEIEGVSLLSNAALDASGARGLSDASLLAGRWTSVTLDAGSESLEFHSASEGFNAPAFSTVAMLRKAIEHLGPLPGGRHLFVEVEEGQGFDAPGLSAWPAGSMLEEEGRDLRIAEALLTNWWGARAAAGKPADDWRSAARLYVATHLLLGKAGPMTRIAWIDEHAYEARRGSSGRRETLRGAMVFHALRRVAGESVFDEVMRALSLRAAEPSWSVVRARFAQATRGESDWVFAALLEGDETPRLVLESIEEDERPGRRGVRVVLSSPGHERIDVEVRVTGEGGDAQKPLASLRGGRAELAFRTRTKPLFVEVDPDAHLLRALDDAEMPPMLGLVGNEAPDLVLLGTGRGEAFLSSARRFARTRPVGQVMLDREASSADLVRAKRVWIVGRPGQELQQLLEEHLPLAGERLAWLGDEAAGPAEARAEGGESWLLAGLGRWHGEGARVVLLDAPEASGLVAASREARAEGPATWRVRRAEGKLVEGRGPRSAQPLVRRLGEEKEP